MKALRLLRWSGSVLSPRIKPCYIHPQFTFILRLQSTASQIQTQNTSDSTSLSSQISSEETHRTPNRISEIDLRSLPSPPPSRASSSAKLSALHSRLYLSPRLPIETLARCLVDASADSHPSFNNASLAILGTDLLGNYTAEAILCRYPRLPMDVIFAAMWAYCGPKTLAALAHEWGVKVAAAPGGEVDPGYLQCKRIEAGNAPFEGTGTMIKDAKPVRPPRGWDRGASSKTLLNDYFGDPATRHAFDYQEKPELRSEDARRLAERAVTVERASTNFVRALAGAVYLHCGKKAAKAFFRAHILSRHLDVSALFEFRQPTRDLSKLCAREGFESPVARILSETGRLSRHPVFIVGVFAGREKLGEGTGSSLDEARIRASVSALKGWYLYSPLEVRVPSDAEGSETKPWEPVLVDCGEVVV